MEVRRLDRILPFSGDAGLFPGVSTDLNNRDKMIPTHDMLTPEV